MQISFVAPVTASGEVSAGAWVVGAVEGGVLAEESADLLRGFFRARRKPRPGISEPEA